MRWWAPAACIAAWLAAAPAEAQPVDNSFAIDLFQGVVLAPIRVTSMGGAYAGYAEGIAGFVANAASPAVRHSHSSGWWNFEIDGSVSFPIVLFRNNDFDNSGDFDADYANFIYLSGGLQLQAGPFGAGFFGDLQRYTLTFPPDDAATYVTVGRYHLLVGWGFFGDQFDVGAGVRALSLGIDATDVAFSVFGASPQVGFLVKPDWTPFRVGATYRHLVRGGRTSESGITEVDGVERAGPLVLPDRVELPWELELGVSLQVGPRPINPRWIDPDEHEAELRDAFEARRKARREQIARRLRRLPAGKMRQQLGKQLWDEERIVAERERRRYARDLDRLIDERRAHARNWPREALLLTADLLITGEVSDAIHLERFLSQGQAPAATPCVAVASGEHVNFSPRFGIEVEPLPGWIHTRFGSYYEPPRYRYAAQPSAPEGTSCEDHVGRQHFTFGADLKLFSTTWFGLVPEVTYKLQGYGDLTARYQSFGGGFGVWY
jgi:hypothetical protein